ncbi:LytR/AlgR family response regulator transcription factor [Sphingobacterium suaedae]|uniref:LytR/AlgR family response regulator transcription factor n=1 Tax=Sphingobacterium suaedae TaxID=1686402 RepID=A0ABW5KES3_9SPHI
MLKVYILEDELNILKYIWSILDEIPYVKVVGYSTEVRKAEIEIKAFMPDLILADIQLKDGFSLELLSRLNLDLPIIFITAYSQYAIEALNIGAIGYITKPIDPALLTEAVDKCHRRAEEYKFNQNQLRMAEMHLKAPSVLQRIALKTFEYTQIVCVEDIVYCEGDKGYTTFFLRDDSKLVVSKVLKYFEELLPDTQFIRCHQSYLVNTRHILKYYKDGQLEMLNKAFVPVSNRKRDLMMQYIDKLC